VRDVRDLANRELMRETCGAPPKLSDMIIINDIAYGISTNDTIYREVVESEVGTTIQDVWYRPPGHPGQGVRRTVVSSKLTHKTLVRAIQTDASMLYYSDPGEPEYMEMAIQVGDGSERLVGLSSLGGVCVIFTNQGIYTFTARDGEEELKKAYARVGAASRESIVATEQGIRFVGTDGMPRVFNGATVDEVANELSLIFDRDDYVGDYARFDKSNPQEIVATQAGRRYFFTFPTAGGPPDYGDPFYPKPGQAIDTTAERQLAVGDASRGRTQWAIDRFKYEVIQWFGRENRLAAVDKFGGFYYIEESLTMAEIGSLESPVVFDWKFRKFAAASGMQGQFHKVALDIDTNGQNVTLECRVDDLPTLVFEYAVNTLGREEFKAWLPAVFKGRFMTVRLYGSCTKRVTLYGIALQSVARGVF
jgi:hypothetical protein